MGIIQFDVENSQLPFQVPQQRLSQYLAQEAQGQEEETEQHENLKDYSQEDEHSHNEEQFQQRNEHEENRQQTLDDIVEPDNDDIRKAEVFRRIQKEPTTDSKSVNSGIEERIMLRSRRINSRAEDAVIWALRPPMSLPDTENYESNVGKAFANVSAVTIPEDKNQPLADLQIELGTLASVSRFGGTKCGTIITIQERRARERELRVNATTTTNICDAEAVNGMDEKPYSISSGQKVKSIGVTEQHKKYNEDKRAISGPTMHYRKHKTQRPRGMSLDTIIPRVESPIAD